MVSRLKSSQSTRFRMSHQQCIWWPMLVETLSTRSTAGFGPVKYSITVVVGPSRQSSGVRSRYSVGTGTYNSEEAKSGKIGSTALGH